MSTSDIPTEFGSSTPVSDIAGALTQLNNAVWNKDHGGDCPPERAAHVLDLFPMLPLDEYGAFVVYATVVEGWELNVKKPGELHPFATAIRQWQNRPKEVVPNYREDRIIPSQIAMFAAVEGDARGRLFSNPGFDREGGQAPLFEGPEHDVSVPSLPVALYELGVNRQSPGTGAPLAFRIFIESILAVKLADRGIDQAVTFTLPMSAALARLYPNRAPKPNEWRPMIAAARDALASRDAGILFSGGRRWVVTITNEPVALDDVLRIVVDLPPGAGGGPQVSPRLHLYGPKHGRHYRALLNLAYWWHEPGKTLIPANPQKTHWLRVNDPSRYRKPTDRQIIDIVFPATAQKNERKLIGDARKVMRDLADDGELRLIDGRILPPLVKK